MSAQPIDVYCSAEPSVVFQWTMDECAESSVMRNLISDLCQQQQPIGVDACSGQELAILTSLVKRLSSAGADPETLAYLAGLEQPELLVQQPLWIEQELRGVVPLSPILQLALYLDMPRISAVLSHALARKISTIHESAYTVQSAVAAVRRLLGIQSDFTEIQETELMADNCSVMFIK